MVVFLVVPCNGWSGNVVYSFLYCHSILVVETSVVESQLAALGSSLEHSIGLYCQSGGMGCCRSWASAVGNSGFTSGECCHFQTGNRLCADNFLYIPDHVYRVVDCRNRHYAESYQEGTGGSTIIINQPLLKS